MKTSIRTEYISLKLFSGWITFINRNIFGSHEGQAGDKALWERPVNNSIICINLTHPMSRSLRLFPCSVPLRPHHEFLCQVQSCWHQFGLIEECILDLYLCEQFISFKRNFFLCIFQLNLVTFLLALLIADVAQNRRQDYKTVALYRHPVSVKPHWGCVQAHKLAAFPSSDRCPKWRMAACGSIYGYSITSRDRDIHCRAMDSTSPCGFSERVVQVSASDIGLSICFC